MANKAIEIQVKGVMDRIRRATKDAISPAQMRAIALEAIDIIVKRTRAGYGVPRNYAAQERLPALSARYVQFRRTFKRLASTTSPKKSNVTLTGELLESIGIRRTSEGSVTIAGIGVRNQKVIGHLNKQGRVFLRISDLEFKQLVRFYRKTFGDLLRRYKLN